MRLSTTAALELLAEINRPVETQAAIVVEVNVQRLEVSRGVDYSNISGLNKVVGDDKVLLVRRDLDIVRANSGLVFVGVVQALDVVQVTNVEGSNVIGGGQREIEETTVLGDIGAVIIVSYARVKTIAYARLLTRWQPYHEP